MGANKSEEEKQKLFDEIIEDISDHGLSLSGAMKGRLTGNTFYKFMNEDEKRIERYARACEMRADSLFDEILEIADNTEEGTVIETDDNGRTKEKKGDMLGHRRLKIDSRKWILSKMNPKKYGDRNTTEITGAGGKDLAAPIQVIYNGKEIDLKT